MQQPHKCIEEVSMPSRVRTALIVPFLPPPLPSPALGAPLHRTAPHPAQHLLVVRVREHIVLDLVREGQAQVALAKHLCGGFRLAS